MYLPDRENHRLRRAFYSNPTLFNNDDYNKEVGDFLLPYSVGMEIETDTVQKEKLKNYVENIELMDYPNDYYHELRFRFHAGLVGIQGLYNVVKGLRKYSNENLESSIHYHIDATDWFHKIKDHHIKVASGWILNELDKWDYGRTYSTRRVGYEKLSWVHLHEIYQTLEFRVGKCVFDYDLMFAQVEHACYITAMLKEYVISGNNFTIESYQRNGSLENPDKLIKSRVKIMY